MATTRLSLTTKNVFIDSSVHIAAKFGYSDGNFRRLCELGESGMVRIFETPVDHGEVHAHIAASAKEASDALRKFQREAAALRTITAPDVAGHFSRLDADAVASHLGRGHAAYLARAKVERLPFPPDVAERVFDEYFSVRAPFGTGKKKSEFPDAFIVATLRSWCEAKGETMYYVSQDATARDAASATGVLTPLESLDEFLNLVVSAEHQDLAIRAHRALRRIQGELIAEITEAFYNAGFYIEDADGDVESVAVEELNLGEPLLVEIAKGHVVFVVDFSATFEADLTYDDPSTGTYDSEEKEMVFMDRRRVRVRRTAEFQAEVAVETNSEAEGDAAVGDEVEIDTITIRNGRDIPVSIEDEVVAEYPDPDEEDHGWYADLAQEREQPPEGDDAE